MAKSDLVVLQEMAEADMDIRSSTNLIWVEGVPKGGIITFCVDYNSYRNILKGMFGEQTHYCVLYVVNKEQFNQLKNEH